MAELRTETSAQTKHRVRSSSFKYYIHDAADVCRLQLLGELTEFDLPELNGCCQTAKTIVGARRLLLDLEQLKSIDEAGRQWIASMVSEGAVCKPESFLRDKLAGNLAPAGASRTARLGVFARLMSLLRGSRVIATE